MINIIEKYSDPIFIIGNARSGTTLLRLMLSSHKNIIIVPENGFSVWLYDKYKWWKYDDCKLDRFLEDLFNTRKFETWNLSYQGLKCFIKDLKPESYNELAMLVYIFYCKSKNDNFKRWGDKNTFYITEIKKIDLIFNNCKFIHIIRDGRDVACSYINLSKRKINSKYAPNLPDNINDIAYQWRSNILKIKNDLSKLEEGRYIEIKYEDLVLFPEKTLKSICKYIGEDYDNNMLKYYDMNQQNDLEPKEFLQWKEKTIQPLDANNIRKYERVLSREEIQIFNNIACDVLRLYDYNI